ncbi:exosome RNA helicase MTR4-like [Arctopsyche grandis]|uniref:exosome RNA helicase MTR4-like n=1 Tax=Arctopsyche grandis TaxID=121162 RepID=UPI00406D96EA
MASIDSLFSLFDIENQTNSNQQNNDNHLSKNNLKRSSSSISTNKKKLKCDEDELNFIMSDKPPKINVHSVTTDNGCLHEVVFNTNSIPELIVKNNPAKKYKFDLDPFQKQAILCIDNNQSVLVSAHTSAGKTVVAEYAIALALRNKQRIIYTTPIKALSNQKYRELAEEFGDVGLMTGDVTIEPKASCIVMTTEILRSMLYRGSELAKEVGWVVFDEIHYMRDRIRGIVWEETIILLPHNVRHVFLSATIPNATQFAEWICYLHDQPCNVVYTEYRPTPLQHYVYPANGDEMLLLVDEKGLFHKNNYNAALSMLGSENTEKLFKKQSFHTPGRNESVLKTVRNVMLINMAPLIVFSFSKAECENFAMGLKNTTYNSDSERKLVDEIFNNAISLLNEDERQLPHVVNVIPLLREGIGFHHGGLLPIIKETIEILFGEGLIKVLFATETFAMGLNMPAKTVIFTSLQKYDGSKSRNISSGEYIQMSGRAGRRGIDEKGVVIALVHNMEVTEKLYEIISGKADPLNSTFHLTYNMILNLLRQEEINPEYIIQKSFLHYQNRAAIKDKKKFLQKNKNKYDNKVIENEPAVLSYFEIKQKLSVLHNKIRDIILSPKYIVKFIHRGRLIKLKSEDNEYDWGVIMNFKKSIKKSPHSNIRDNKYPNFDMKIDVLLHVEKSNSLPNYIPNPFSTEKKGQVGTFTVDYRLIYQISAETVDISQFNGNKNEKQKKFLKFINKIKNEYPDGLPLLHPISDMNITDERVPRIVEEITNYENALLRHSLHRNKNRNSLCEKLKAKQKILCEIKDCELEITNVTRMLMLNELQQRKLVLRTLGYCDDTDIITVKGRVACEFSCDELLLTEIIFSGILNKTPVDYCVALLSCLLCQEKIANEPNFDGLITEAIGNVRQLISKVDKVMKDVGLVELTSDTIHEFQPHMINVILTWCGGASFLEACKVTSIYEGSIIRYMRGTEEILRQLFKAAKNIGNIDLEVKLSDGIKRLKRGIVFAASLYL